MKKRRPYRKVYCGQVFIKIDGVHHQIHPDGTLVTPEEIEESKQKGIKCFDNFLTDNENEKK